MRIHPIAGVAAISFLLLGAVVAVRGEMNAQALQHRRDEILADLPRRAREIEKQLSDPALDATTRERLQGQLDAYKHGQTGIPAHFPYNERVSGYVIGAGLVAMGLVCLLYRPKAISSRSSAGPHSQSKESKMPVIDMNKYGIVPLTFFGTVCESPATEGDLHEAPVIFLIDECHDDPKVVTNNEVVAENVQQVANILNELEAVVGIEHHPSRMPITKQTPPRGSTFHRQLLESCPNAHIIGVDHAECLTHLDALCTDMYSIPVSELDDPLGPQLSIQEKEEKKVEYDRAYIQASNTDPCQWVRSHTFIETVLNVLRESGGRAGIINAGSHHNDHIWTNTNNGGGELFGGRRAVSLIRVRCPSHPTLLNCGPAAAAE